MHSSRHLNFDSGVNDLCLMLTISGSHYCQIVLEADPERISRQNGKLISQNGFKATNLFASWWVWFRIIWDIFGELLAVTGSGVAKKLDRVLTCIDRIDMTKLTYNLIRQSQFFSCQTPSNPLLGLRSGTHSKHCSSQWVTRDVTEGPPREAISNLKYRTRYAIFDAFPWDAPIRTQSLFEDRGIR